MDVYHLPLEHRVLGPILAQKARSEGERPYLTHGARTYSGVRGRSSPPEGERNG